MEATARPGAIAATGGRRPMAQSDAILALPLRIGFSYLTLPGRGQGGPPSAPFAAPTLAAHDWLWERKLSTAAQKTKTTGAPSKSAQAGFDGPKSDTVSADTSSYKCAFDEEDL